MSDRGMWQSLGLAALAIVWSVGICRAAPTVAAKQALVLYDGSKSMYPGYRVGERSADPRPAYFHARADFVAWLLDFMAKQARAFAVPETTLAAFYNTGEGRHVRIESLRRFESAGEMGSLAETADATTIFHPLTQAHEHAAYGMETQLRQALHQASQHFSGIIWLITDNVVEEGLTAPDERDLNELFEHIRDDSRYVAAHVYSFPYEMDGHRGALAVYGFLVSPTPLDRSVQEAYDTIFFHLIDAFPGKRHLKLKDITVRPLGTELTCTANVENEGGFASQTGQSLRFQYQATVTSHFTQHTVSSGTCTVAAEEFRPDEASAKAYGLEPLPGDWLAKQSQTVPSIAPGGQWRVSGVLRSQGEIALPGLTEAGRKAWEQSGQPVTYRGRFRVTFSDIALHFEPQRLEEIYGMRRALAVFGINAETQNLPEETLVIEKTIEVYPPELGPDASTDSVLPAVAGGLLAVALLGGLLFFWRRTVSFRVTVSGETRLVRLHPLGTFRVLAAGMTLGVLRRGLGRDADYRPVEDGLGQTTTRLPSGIWQTVLASPKDGKTTFEVAIENLSGGTIGGSNGRSTEAKGGAGPSLKGASGGTPAGPPRRIPPVRKSS